MVLMDLHLRPWRNGSHLLPFQLVTLLMDSILILFQSILFKLTSRPPAHAPGGRKPSLSDLDDGKGK